MHHKYLKIMNNKTSDLHQFYVLINLGSISMKSTVYFILQIGKNYQSINGKPWQTIHAFLYYFGVRQLHEAFKRKHIFKYIHIYTYIPIIPEKEIGVKLPLKMFLQNIPEQQYP